MSVHVFMQIMNFEVERAKSGLKMYFTNVFQNKSYILCKVRYEFTIFSKKS
jgi:hypothetical protein